MMISKFRTLPMFGRTTRNISSVILNSDFLSTDSSAKINYKTKMAEYFETRKNRNLKQKVFKHPMDSKYHPINSSPFRTSELIHDFVGPEQVSANYEPLSVARQFALTSLFAVFGCSYLMKISDLNWVLESTYTGLFYYTL